jgi:hypothetical protein
VRLSETNRPSLVQTDGWKCDLSMQSAGPLVTGRALPGVGRARGSRLPSACLSYRAPLQRFDKEVARCESPCVWISSRHLSG